MSLKKLRKGTFVVPEDPREENPTNPRKGARFIRLCGIPMISTIENFVGKKCEVINFIFRDQLAYIKAPNGETTYWTMEYLRLSKVKSQSKR